MEFAGPNNEFLPMSTQCFEIAVTQYVFVVILCGCVRMFHCLGWSCPIRYVYEFCPYGEAKQKEGGRSTSLG